MTLFEKSVTHLVSPGLPPRQLCLPNLSSRTPPVFCALAPLQSGRQRKRENNIGYTSDTLLWLGCYTYKVWQHDTICTPGSI